MYVVYIACCALCHRAHQTTNFYLLFTKIHFLMYASVCLYLFCISTFSKWLHFSHSHLSRAFVLLLLLLNLIARISERKFTNTNSNKKKTFKQSFGILCMINKLFVSVCFFLWILLGRLYDVSVCILHVLFFSSLSYLLFVVYVRLKAIVEVQWGT